jgi:hypothetical protein
MNVYQLEGALSKADLLKKIRDTKIKISSSLNKRSGLLVEGEALCNILKFLFQLKLLIMMTKI